MRQKRRCGSKRERVRWRFRRAFFVIAVLCPWANAADPSWIAEHALRADSDVVEDLQQHVRDATAAKQSCVLEVGEGLLDTPALLFVEDGHFHPRALRPAEADALGLAARRVGVRCETPIAPTIFRAVLGDPADGVTRLRPGASLAGSISVDAPKGLRGELALALVLESPGSTGRQILWSYLEEPAAGEVAYKFEGMEPEELPAHGIVIAELVLCVDRVAISNRVPLVLVFVKSRPTDPDHA